MDREAETVCGGEIREHRFVNGPEVPPRVRVGVEAPQEQQVGQHAFHPVHVGLVADDGPAARPFQELIREPPSARSRQHAACGEIDEVIVGGAPTLERLAQACWTEPGERGAYRPGAP